ncbi:hypothetical protein E2320_020497 [Naja naja]|nr:hypothetical protein E2320_020497 [Naja naja]
MPNDADLRFSFHSHTPCLHRLCEVSKAMLAHRVTYKGHSEKNIVGTTVHFYLGEFLYFHTLLFITKLYTVHLIVLGSSRQLFVVIINYFRLGPLDLTATRINDKIEWMLGGGNSAVVEISVGRKPKGILGQCHILFAIIFLSVFKGEGRSSEDKKTTLPPLPLPSLNYLNPTVLNGYRSSLKRKRIHKRIPSRGRAHPFSVFLIQNFKTTLIGAGGSQLYYSHTTVLRIVIMKVIPYDFNFFLKKANFIANEEL